LFVAAAAAAYGDDDDSDTADDVVEEEDTCCCLTCDVSTLLLPWNTGVAAAASNVSPGGRSYAV